MSARDFESLVNSHYMVPDYGLVYTEAIPRRCHGVADSKQQQQQQQPSYCMF